MQRYLITLSWSQLVLIFIGPIFLTYGTVKPPTNLQLIMAMATTAFLALFFAVMAQNYKEDK